MRAFFLMILVLGFTVSPSAHAETARKAHVQTRLTTSSCPLAQGRGISQDKNLSGSGIQTKQAVKAAQTQSAK